jgi:AraC-like DNA-binding protein
MSCSGRHEVGAGELLVVPPNTPHTYGADEAHPWTIPWVHAAGAHVGYYLQELGASAERPVLSLGDHSQLHSLFEEILEAVEHGYAPAQLLYSSHALAHLLAVMILHRRHPRSGELAPEEKIPLTIQHMKQHLAGPLQLSTLASLANLSASHYTALFKRQTGYAPIDYFIRLRIHRAAQLLDTSSLSVKAVAEEVGYGDHFYFSRTFKRINGAGPTLYRARRKG